MRIKIVIDTNADDTGEIGYDVTIGDPPGTSCREVGTRETLVEALDEVNAAVEFWTIGHIAHPSSVSIGGES
jgi:hypothetical protein